MKDCTIYTVPKLKEMLKKRGLKVGGTKPELCARLEADRKAKCRASRRKPASIPVKISDPNDSIFKFYASLYYQMPGSIMASSELQKYGLTKPFLDKFTNHKQLFDYLRKT